MILKILKRGFLRKKIITIAVFIFIMLSAMLMASGTNMFIDLSNSLNYLFEKSLVPHFVQYHSGEISQKQIDEWSTSNPYVKNQQTAEMINIDGSKIYINSNMPESDTVIDMGFVKQNKFFDYLLDLNNEIIEVKEGQIAVPIHFKQKKDLSIGDKIIIRDEGLGIAFTITSFVRDVQMNPSIIHSKRFVVSDTDFEKLKRSTGELEYLIEFRLKDTEKLHEFSNQYNHSDLPQKGIAIDYQMLKILNYINDGLIAAVIILLSLLLNVIAFLCLRFVILLTMEEDYKEIGVMKAIGISLFDIKRIYLSKYFIVALTSSLVGYLVSLYINNIFSKNIMLYLGRAPKNILESIIPFLAALFIAIIVIIFCVIILKRFNKISTIEALRMGSTGRSFSNNRRLSLYRSKISNPNIFMGLRDVVLRFRLYALLFFVFILCTFIVIVPLNFLNTIQSPDIVTYMGMGKSDIIMDLRQSDEIIERFEKINTYLKHDPDVEQFEPFVTCKYEIINKDGFPEDIFIETGDFTVFPLDYLEGTAPLLSNEIALSYLSASEMGKHVGDEVELIINGKKQSMIVTGIYQDITNGGRTAKANILPNHETASWYTFYVNVNTDIYGKVMEYGKIFDDLRITYLRDYFQQTFGNTIDRLRLLTITAIIIAGLITVLITSLFLKMLIAKDRSQIAIKRSLGISLTDIRLEYITKALVVLTGAILIGTFFSNIVGQKMLSMVLSMFGASRITFTVNPFEAYILTPVVMIIIVTLTTLLSISTIKEYNISDINTE